MTTVTLGSLNRHNQRAIHAAGARYTPGLDPNAPNLEVKVVADCIDAVGFAPSARAAVQATRLSLDTAWHRAPADLQARLTSLVCTPESVLESLKQLEVSTVRAAPRLCGRSMTSTSTLQRYLRGRVTALRKSEFTETDTDRKSRLGYQRQVVERFLASVDDVAALLRHMAEPLQRQLLVVRGEWGTGKTHSLCDMVRLRMEARLPTLLVLGQQLPSGVNPLDAIARHCGSAPDGTTLLRRLNSLGRTKGTRALLLVDAINEGDRRAWRQHLPSMIRAVRRYKHVGLVLSCRRPFDDEIFSNRTSRQVAFVEHRGFSEIEFDAQLSFFNYYRLSAPQFPMLDAEFSRPLFLKALCRSLEGVEVRRQHRQLRTFASGQRGMTHLLEQFVLESGAQVEARLGLPGRTCWRILKGARPTPDAPVTGLAPIMASGGTTTVPRQTALEVIELFTGGARSTASPEDVLRALCNEGLLAEDVRWTKDGATNVIRLPYERFSDHLIARHLLDRYLDASSPDAIAACFAADNPLAAVFRVNEWGIAYALPGIASAVMLEFPERVRRHVPADEAELVYFLPEAQRLVQPFRTAFLQGLSWRSRESFTEQTGRLISQLLDSKGDGPDDVYEVLVGLATRPGHPLSADLLFENVAKMPMADRDLVWSEYVRNAEPTSVVYRLIAWVERLPPDETSVEAAHSALVVLALLLTTTRRSLRNAATRALVLLGERFPAQLFSLTLRSLTFNDPYVPERLLAACYGVVMRRWADPNARGRLGSALVPFVRELAQALYIPPAAHATAHALARDSAQGLFTLARKLTPNCIPRRWFRHLKRPASDVPYMPPSGAVPTDVQRADTEPALRMDFNNYTLGRLVANRGNYQFEHAGYQDVRNRLLIRMAALGYSASRFKAIDEYIGGQNWHVQGDNRTDRYGKKYSWIAYFELYAAQHDGKRLSDWRASRPSDMDIDPSFPTEKANTWQPALDDVFQNTPDQPRDWLLCGRRPGFGRLLARSKIQGHTGPWVLLDGYVEQVAPDDPRRVFSFIRGFLVAPEDVERFCQEVARIEFLGNQLPDASEDHDVFCGEVPWSRRFGQELRSLHGKARPQLEAVFSTWNGSRRVGGIEVELPVYQCSFKSDITEDLRVFGVVPSPVICELGHLSAYGGDFQLFDPRGLPATMTARWRGERNAFTSHLLYIRKSLLKKYLRMTGKRLVIVAWGERDFTIASQLHDDKTLHPLWQSQINVHRHLHVLAP